MQNLRAQKTAGLTGAVIRLEKGCVQHLLSNVAAIREPWAIWLAVAALVLSFAAIVAQVATSGMPDNAINTDGKHARAFGAHVFAAGYGERSAS